MEAEQHHLRLMSLGFQTVFKTFQRCSGEERYTRGRYTRVNFNFIFSSLLFDVCARQPIKMIPLASWWQKFDLAPRRFSVIRLVLFNVLHNYLRLLYCPCVCHSSTTFSNSDVGWSEERLRQTSEEGPHFIGSSALRCLSQSALSPATNRRRFIKS